jgi:hypothetical protein
MNSSANAANDPAYLFFINNWVVRCHFCSHVFLFYFFFFLCVTYIRVLVD